MSENYKIRNPQKIYFITSTIINWIMVFDKSIYKDIIVDSLNYCIKNKGLEVYAWVIMSNHIHLIIGTNTNKLSGIIRDFKKHTSKQILKKMHELNEKESAWILDAFKKQGSNNPNNKTFQVWQQPYYAIEGFSTQVLMQKLNYLHMNPVRAGIVVEPEHYLYSSASDYRGKRGKVEVILLKTNN